MKDPQTTFHVSEIRTWQVTPRLRWLRQSFHDDFPALEQAHHCLETGEIKWIAVQTEIAT